MNADLSIPIVFDENPTLPQNAALDEFESMEGLSGTRFNDVLAGTEDVAADRLPLAQGGSRQATVEAFSTQQSIALIAGLQAVLGAVASPSFVRLATSSSAATAATRSWAAAATTSSTATSG